MTAMTIDEIKGRTSGELRDLIAQADARMRLLAGRRGRARDAGKLDLRRGIEVEMARINDLRAVMQDELDRYGK